MSKRNSKIISSVIIVFIYLLTFQVVYFIFPLFTFSQIIINVLATDITATIVIFIFSMSFSNSSIYDPYWSIVPLLIVFYLVTLFPHGNHARQLLILALVIFWSIRLTINWYRGWQGISHQDWRYTSIAEKAGKWYWPVSFLGIHFMPTIFVFSGCLPLWYSISGTAPFNIYDILAALFTLSAILTEWLADEQLIKFRKNNSKNSIIRTGIWKYSRHPNYLGEISFWGGLFLFVITSGGISNFEGYWTIVGLVSMIILFKFISIPIMEKRNKTLKYGYSKYIEQVPALLPRLFNHKI
jgi:steroid 5-alpha reductase family enzyme